MRKDNKGSITKENIDQTKCRRYYQTNGQDQESAELATRLLSKIKDSN